MAKVFSSGETAEQPLHIGLRSVGNRQKWLFLHFTRAQADVPVNLKVLEIPRTIDAQRHR
jgi:hypothetical protein